jgi:hypothetical protein
MYIGYFKFVLGNSLEYVPFPLFSSGCEVTSYKGCHALFFELRIIVPYVYIVELVLC